MLAMLREAFSITRLSFWIGALMSSLVGCSMYISTQHSIESDAHERFINHVRYAQSMIGLRIKSYTDLLRGAASQIQSSDILTHRQFHEYVRGLDMPNEFPAVDSINFAHYFPDAQRAAFVADLRREMQRYVTTKEPLDITPPGKRPYYLAISFVEPDRFTPGHYGVDLLANRFFGKNLMAERDTGKIQASGTPIPQLSTPNDSHMGMRLAVYRLGAQLDTVAQRRAAYIGSLGIAFSIPKLLHGVVDEIPVPGIRMTLYDSGTHIGLDGIQRVRPYTLFDSGGKADHPVPTLATGKDVFSAILPLDFNGRPWQTVYTVSKSSLHTDFDDDYPKLMMAFGFFGSLMLYTLLFILTSSRRNALSLAREMTSELRESQNKLQLSHQKLRRLADHAYQVKEMERKRIAREIHDDLGQSLLALRIEAELLAVRSRGTHSHLYKRAQATLMQIDATIKSVRQIINDLRPTVLDLGLSAAVEWQVHQFHRRTGIQCEIHDDHGEIAMSDHCATAFFRILQESLNNVVRHAKASRVVVELRLYGGWLTLIVRDNGCGLPPDGRNKHGSFGLVGIEERIVILGGTCAVFSERDGGTTIMVSAPVVGAQEPPLPLEIEHEHESSSAVI
jgi:signal transduction histidine kinase